MLSHAFHSVLAVFTAVYLLLAAGSCSVKPEETVYSPQLGISLGVSGGETPVNILQCMPDTGYALQTAAEEYGDVYGRDDLSFHIQTVSNREDYRAKLRTSILSGEAVDLFHLTGASDVERLADYLLDLSGLEWLDEAPEDVFDPVARPEGIYGVPYSMEGSGFLANRRVFEAAGVSLAEIHDFESFSEALVELRDAIDAGELREAFPELEAVTDFAGQDKDYLSGEVAEWLLAGAAATPYQAHRSAGVTLVNAEPAEELVKLLARVSPHRQDWTLLPGVTQERMVENGLAAERVAMVYQSTTMARRIVAANPGLLEQLTFLPVYFPDREEGVVFRGSTVWWGVRAAAAAKTREGATGFLTWLYCSEEGTQRLADDFGVLSPFADAAQAGGLPLHRQMLRQTERSAAAPRLAPEAPGRWGEDVFAEQLQAYFTVYDKSWESLVEACETGWMEQRLA